MSGNAEQFKEFMEEMKYATGCVKAGKFNLGQYYDQMAGFFDYIELPKDAQEHRVLAKKWEIEKGDNDENR